MTVKTKITLPLIVAVVVVGLLAAWLVAWQLGGLEKAFTSRIVDNKIEEAKSGLAAAGGFAVEQASVLGGAPEVLAAYEMALSGNVNDETDPAAQKAREALRAAMKPMLEAYSQANDGKKLQLHYHLPNNRSLVRLWRPKQIKRDGKDLDVSDDLTSFRPTVVEANKSLKPVKGVEIGVGGFAVRGVAPVKSAAGKHLGSNEVLVEFTPILSRLASGPDEDVALFMNADLLSIAQELQDKAKYPLLGEKFVRVIAPKNQAVLEAIDPALLEAGRTKTTVRSVGGRTLAAFPIKDFRDAQVGVAVYALDASSTAGFITGVTWTVAGALLVVLIIPLATIRLAFRRFVDQPLTDIIRIIRDITEDRADLGARLSEASQDEIGELAKWFNKLLHKLSDMICLEESVINAMPDPLFVVDENYRIKIANKATAKIAGKTPTELMGTRCADIFRTPACDTPECPIAMRMRDQRRTELIDTAIGGERVVIRPIVDKMTDCDGKIIGYLELAQIVTPMVVKEEELQANLARIAEVNREITEAATQIGGAAESVAGRVSDVAHGAAVQRQRVDETVTAMEEMNAVVLEVARNAADAARQTDETRDKANRGEEVARESVAAIEQARKLALDLKAKMDALGRRAEDIGKVVDVISDIADQTNLLALNAAIEAARAGDAGRGFAVVADEVRKLAEKTMNATGEVGQSIQAIQRDAKDSVAVTEQAAKAVGKGVELTQNSGAALAEIKELVNKAADQVQAIAAAAEEQSASAEEVQRAVEDISRVSSETADGMTKASDSIGELTGIVTRLTELARK